MKVRIGVLAVVLVAVIGFASTASACERCVSAGYNGWTKCESGHASGKQSCYGGFGTACTTSGTCGSGGGGVDEPLVLEPLSAPCVTCSGDQPAQGFVLRTEPLEVADRSAEGDTAGGVH
jgi:hypothetical protein